MSDEPKGPKVVDDLSATLTDDQKTEFERLQEMFAPEDLHEDLKACLTNGVLSGMQFIAHPLIHEPIHHPNFNKMVNKRYLLKKEECSKALKEDNWHSYVWLHERPYRLDAFFDCVDHGLDGEEYWKLLSSIWTDSENIHQQLDEWRAAWESNTYGRKAVMDEDDQKAFDALPEEFEVWRGYTVEAGKLGMSWTVDRDKAKWFGYRFSHAEHRPPRIAHGRVKKSEVLAYFGGRNESEIVVLAETVAIISARRLPPRKSK